MRQSVFARIVPRGHNLVCLLCLFCFCCCLCCTFFIDDFNVVYLANSSAVVISRSFSGKNIPRFEPCVSLPTRVNQASSLEKTISSFCCSIIKICLFFKLAQGALRDRNNPNWYTYKHHMDKDGTLLSLEGFFWLAPSFS